MAAAALVSGPWTQGGLAAQEATEPLPPVLVEGQVVDHDTGDPVPGATVSLGAGPSGTRGRGTRVSDDEGRFGFEDVPAGTYRVYVTSVGYRRMTDTLQVTAEADLDVRLPLSTEPIELEPIVVTAKPRPMLRRGWDARRRSGGGFVVEREEIRRRSPRYLSELLNRVPGGIVVPTPPQGYTLLLRGQCRPGIWIDGTPVMGASIDRIVSPMDVEAVEVYHGFELPVEFGVNNCGGVLIWTRRGTPTGGDGSASSILAPLARVLVIVATLLVITR